MKKQTCPMSALEVLDAGFLEARARVVEIAALLDRVDRAGEPERGRADYRYKALREAIKVLHTASEARAKAVRAMAGIAAEPEPSPSASRSLLMSE